MRNTPVTISKVQTPDRTINQLQSNVTNSLQSIGNQLNQVTIVGEIKQATITEAQFQSQAGQGWVSCDGRSIVGSSLNKLTGQLTAPTTANSFLRIN